MDLPTNLEETDITDLTFETTMEYLEQLMLEPDKKTQKEYDKIRNGTKLKFDIYNILTENYTIKPKKQKIIIENKTYDLKEFYTEFAKRKALAKAILRQALKKPQTPYTRR